MIYFPVGFVGLMALIFGTAYLTFDESEIDIMSPDNLARPTPDNDRINGAGIIFDNGTRSDFVIIHLANGTNYLTDCPIDLYPQWQNSTHFQCGDYGNYKTYHEFVRLSN